MSDASFKLTVRFVLAPGQSETNCSDDLGDAYDQSQIGNLEVSRNFYFFSKVLGLNEMHVLLS